MTKYCFTQEKFILMAIGMLLMIACLPRAQAVTFQEESISSVGVADYLSTMPALPRAEPVQIAANFKGLGEMLDRLEVLDDSDSPANIVASLHEIALSTSTELPISLADDEGDGSPVSNFLVSQSEAPVQCRASGVERSAYNYGAVVESECTCELYQRNPSARFSGASGQEFHWVKSCKKSRYKAG